ncbi:MAG: squalene synthase HpnD [Verrucomicrobia bacterium]|nr:squalene synthase HpnD [Verrucomicrobiota bacterium]
MSVQSAQVSEGITQRSQSNLTAGFILLPEEKRYAMSALYAFCREVDDVADEESAPVETRRRQLAEWREDIRTACAGGQPKFVVNRELQPFIQKYHLSYEHFDSLIRGCEMDLETFRYETMADMENYCYHVASVVGLLSIQIFEYKNPACKDYAVHLGKALQYTNILRDVRNDAERGRIYLPLVELRKHGVTEAEILEFKYTPKFRDLAKSIATQACGFYDLARQTLPPEDKRNMMTAELMGMVYGRLLVKLESVEFNVFGPKKIRLSKPQKISLIFRTWLGMTMGGTVPGYGIR